MLSKVLRKCQFTEPSERQLVGTKMTKEIIQLEQWFENMAMNIGDKVKKEQCIYANFYLIDSIF